MEERLKVLVIGLPQSGKSCLVNYMTGRLDAISTAYRPTVGARILKAQLPIKHDASPNGQRLDVQFWDLSGDPKYENCWPACKDGVDGIILVVNADQRASQEDIEGLIRNFPKDMGIRPAYCLGLLHHTSGMIKSDAKPQQICGLSFNHSSIEDGKETIWPNLNGFLTKITNKKIQESASGPGGDEDQDNQ